MLDGSGERGRGRRSLIPGPATDDRNLVHDYTSGMQTTSLDELARRLVGLASTAGGGHTAETLYGGRRNVLRQTVIGMTKGSKLSEHENPGEATVQVLSGHVTLTSGDQTWEGRSRDLIVVPDSRHSLEALEDSAILLTVAKI